MSTIIKSFREDLQIAKALIARDGDVTRQYFYRQCYPLFKSIFDNYYTDCTCVKEFIDEIYIVVLAPSRTTGKCQMENFKGESTLTSWLKTACLYYCYAKFDEKLKMPVCESVTCFSDKNNEEGDRNEDKYASIEIDFNKLNRDDACVILSMMPNKRYRQLIELRYLELKTNEETAKALGMTMENYYNKHKLAKKQYEDVLKREERYE